MSSEESPETSTAKAVAALTPYVPYAIAIALFWIIFVWNFWENGLFALGLNVTIFWSASIALILYAGPRELLSEPKHRSWLIPIGMLCLSFSIFENPFLKFFTLGVLPIAFLFFYDLANKERDGQALWGAATVFIVILRSLMSPFMEIGSAFGALFSFKSKLRTGGDLAETLWWRVLKGVLILFVLAGLVVIPLLSSADLRFEEATKVLQELIFEPILELFKEQFIARVIVFFILCVGLLSVVGSRKQPLGNIAPNPERRIDSLVAGIVLGGILLLYVLFLYFQLERLWVGTLPIDFKATERLVKSGFWQLFAITVLNIGLFIYYYRATNREVQHLLGAFTISSLLMLASAGYRMALYVIYYSFSYEKFFACYTVIYCAILLGILLYAVFGPKRVDIIRAGLFLFIWMYGLVSIFPVEQFIYRTNIVLVERPGARLQLSEMRMLSTDVLALVEDNVNGKHEELSEQAKLTLPAWKYWIKRNKRRIKEKRWYELNLTALIYKIRTTEAEI